MRKIIFMVMFASAAAIYQPAKAQVSLSLNIGTPVVYEPVYYGYNSYYAPTRYVYSNRNHYVRNPHSYYGKRVVVYKQPHIQHRIYRTNYSRPAVKHYGNRNFHYKANKFNHGKSNHGRRH